jgi:hypothetical protein
LILLGRNAKTRWGEPAGLELYGHVAVSDFDVRQHRADVGLIDAAADKHLHTEKDHKPKVRKLERTNITKSVWDTAGVLTC